MTALSNDKRQASDLKLLLKKSCCLQEQQKGGSNYIMHAQTFYCLFKRPLQCIVQLSWWAFTSIESLPTPKKLVDSVLQSLALGPSLVYSHLPCGGGGNLSRVQLVVLISRCQEFENDLAHQLVGIQHTRESLYH